MGETMKTIVTLIGALAVLALAPAANADPVTAKVESGVLTGQAAGDVAVYRAVPYAAPPVGPLRWKPPERAIAWTGARDASANGPSCMQVMNANGRPNGGGASGPISENCLTLNVFAPKGAVHAPVMVWIHGGANTVGAGSIYDGSAFAKDGIVYVAINYRMGPFGFFAHPALTKEAPSRQPLANYALMDQIAALKWVKRNAKAFGGDPDNITVFGESAGAIDIVALLGTPAGEGLFNRAIMESNIGWGGAQTLAKQEANGVTVATNAGLPGATATTDQLRAIPADKLLAAGGVRGLAGTTIDGRMVTQSAYDAFAAGHGVDVPVIIGTNSFEASLIAGAPGITAQQETDFVNGAAGAPARWIAGKFNAKGSPAWLYFFSYVGSTTRATAPGAGHATEISYVYDWPAGFFGPMSDEDKTEAKLMHSCWVAFAKTGAPACATGPKWPTYSSDSDQLMEFGTGGDAVRTNLRKPELDAAEQHQAQAKP
jgi:para-nitrobenzyl esterase